MGLTDSFLESAEEDEKEGNFCLIIHDVVQIRVKVIRISIIDIFRSQFVSARRLCSNGDILNNKNHRATQFIVLAFKLYHLLDLSMVM